MSCSRRPGNDTLLQYAAEEVVCWWKDKKQQAVYIKGFGLLPKEEASHQTNHQYDHTGCFLRTQMFGLTIKACGPLKVIVQGNQQQKGPVYSETWVQRKGCVRKLPGI